jgi:hypothetical protein
MDVPRLARNCFVSALLVSLLALPAHADGVPVSAAQPAQTKALGKKLAEGNKLFKAGKFDQALRVFQEAYEIVADPEARLMIARTQQSMGDLPKAHAEYQAAIADAQAAVQHHDKYRETLQAAQNELKELEGVVAWLTIKLRHAPEGTRVTIEGEPIDPSKLSEPVLLPPGLVNVVATTPDGREASRQLTLNAGQRANVDLAFARDDSEPLAEEGVETEREEEAAPASSSGGGTRTAAFIAGGVGIAGLATFGIFGAMSNSKFSELEDACPDDRCDQSREGDIDDGKTFQTVANVGLAVGIIGLGTSAALFIFGGSGGAEQKSDSAKLDLGVGPTSITLRGRFQ